MRRIPDRFFSPLLFIVFLAGACFITWPLVFNLSDTLLVSSETAKGLPTGDLAVFLHALWWVKESLLHYHALPWFCPILGAPDGISLISTTLAPLLGLLSIPVSLFLNYIAIYNIWVLFSIALLPFVTCLVARELGASRIGGILSGGILFFPAFFQSHLNHLNLLAGSWFLPLAYFCYLRFLRTRRAAWAAGVGIALGCVFHICFYHTVHVVLLLLLDGSFRLWSAEGGLGRNVKRLILGLGALALVWGALWPLPGSILLVLTFGLLYWQGLRKLLLNGAIRSAAYRAMPAVGIVIVIVLPFFWVKMVDPRHGEATARVNYEAKVALSAQPMSYVLSASALRIVRDQGWMDGAHDVFSIRADGEFAIFPGYFVWLLLLGFVPFWRHEQNMKTLLLASLCFMILSFGPILRWDRVLHVPFMPGGVIFLPGTLFDLTALLDGYRVFSRMGFVALFCMAVATGLGWSGLFNRVLRRPVALAAVCVMLVLVWAERLEWPMHLQEIEVPGIYRQLVTEDYEDAVLAEFPATDLAFLYPQTIHGRRLVNFYGSRLLAKELDKARSNSFLWNILIYGASDLWRNELMKSVPSPSSIRGDFESLGVDGVIFHKGRIHPDHQEPYRSLFEETLGLRRSYEQDGVVLYRQ